MNDRFARILQVNDSGLGCLLAFIVFGLFLGSIGLGWVFNGILFLFAFLLISPILGWIGLNWWLKRNLIEDSCPVCDYQFTAINNQECNCPSCGEPIQVKGGRFQRITPPGIIDVDAIEVPTKQLE